MQEEDAFLGELDVDELIAQHRESAALLGNSQCANPPDAPEVNKNSAANHSRAGLPANCGHSMSQQALCCHGVSFLHCTHR